MLFEDTYLTISAPAEALFKDKGSKFITYAYPVTTEEEVKQYLQQLKKEHFNANHHCYAFRLGADKMVFRANDDGEPANTAGRPILGQIQSKDLTNILIVVVRYFGGTLLGVSGLINAYKTSTTEVIAVADIITKTVEEIYEVQFEYFQMNDVMKIMKDNSLKIINQQFDVSCSIIFSVRRNNANKVNAAIKDIDKISIKYLRTE
jgi:uncharacterized YigZ family protein